MSDTEPAESDSNGEPPSAPSSLKGLTNAVGIEPADPDHDPIIGRDIGGVTIVRLIAEGGMGRVYEGLQESPRRPVAVKVIRPGFVSSQVTRRFSLETEILARLQHPYIAQIYSAGICDIVGAKVPFFVMEFIPEAQSITRYARQKGLSTRDRLALFRKACEAVAHGHHNGVIHRDLKPGNILVDRAGTPKVIDFGVARCIDTEAERITALTDMGQLIGTLQYMSPEQIAADPSKIDVRSDVYALGVILYELLTNQRPYEISQQQIFEAMRVVQETKPVAPSSLNREVSADVEVIAGRCLHKSHDQRFADAAALVSAIDRHLGGGPTGAIDPGWQSSVGEVFESPVPPPRSWMLPFAIAVVGVLMAVITAVLWHRPGSGRSPHDREWEFREPDALADFDVGGVAAPVPGGGVKLGNGVAVSSVLTKDEFTFPLRVEYDVSAGPDRIFDVFPGLFVTAINTRSGIQYLFGDNANTRSFVLILGRYMHLPHQPVEPGRVYRVVLEVDADRRLTVTRDGDEIYTELLPTDAHLHGRVQCGGGLGDVTYKRLRIDQLPRPSPTPPEPTVPGVDAAVDVLDNAIVGRWRWFVDGGEVPEVEFLPRGVIKGKPDSSWLLVDPQERRYQLVWKSRTFLDVVTLSQDGNTLRGTNNEGRLIEGRRH